MPYFITVANRSKAESAGVDLIVEGNEHVLRARFADADFFVREDMKRSLESFLPRLDTLVFQKKLGSMLDKSRRIRAMVPALGAIFGLNAEQLAVAERAAELCKADLATQMVVEMTSLQGTIGRHYALRSGESPAVAQAVFEHYLPRSASDQVPQELPGLVVGVADRLDTLAGLFAAGLAPSGTKDPFAQRRAALGLVQALMALDLEIDLRQAVSEIAAPRLPIQAAPEAQAAVWQFIADRQRSLLLDQGYRYDVVDAVLAAQAHNPASAFRAVKELSAWVAFKDWSTILPAYSRCVRITRDLKERYAVNKEMLVEEAERHLLMAIERTEGNERRPASVDGMLGVFAPMIPVINRFFNEVLVMADDAALRQNRLGMLQRVAALTDGVADFSKLEGF